MYPSDTAQNHQKKKKIKTTHINKPKNLGVVHGFSSKKKPGKLICIINLHYFNLFFLS